MDDSTIRRAELHASLGEPARLAIIDELVSSDRTPSELASRFGLSTNLLAHHLAILERVGLVERTASAGDRRRRYVRLVPSALDEVRALPPGHHGPALFVCTQNSARSQLAAALWRQRVGTAADSAGTRPAERVHPEAVAVAEHHGLDLTGSRPRQLDPDELGGAELVVTVCDLAHEELTSISSNTDIDALHWSIPDPAGDHASTTFDETFAELDRRITALATPPVPPSPVTVEPGETPDRPQSP